MNEMSRFERLTATARGDGPPTIDVRAAVLRTLASPAPLSGLDRPMLASTLVAVAAAVVAAVVALPTLAGLTDPMSALVSSLTMVMQ
jgi:hypothetical protein